MHTNMQLNDKTHSWSFLQREAFILVQLTVISEAVLPTDKKYTRSRN